MPRLRRSDCAAPGISRRRRGRGFEYLDPARKRVDDPEVLGRIEELAIPPAWREVWVCMDPLGHLQATGADAAGRKQYLYHERWRAHRDRQKFDSMVSFGERLPTLRRRVAADLRRADAGHGAARPEPAVLSAKLVTACAVRLLDLGFFRIGSEDYASRNESYGLTTMLRRHVSIDGGVLVFDFPAKSGRRRVQAVADTDSLAVVSVLKRRRAGEQLLAYREGRRWNELQAEQVNEYIKAAAGAQFTAKDFRTWNATVLAAVALAARADTPPGRRERAVSASIKTVAEYLGNTPAVCRASYVDPRVVDRYKAGSTIVASLGALDGDGPDLSRPRVRRRVESAVLELLDGAS
jgi:DNA topoisomerase IB